jgi:hypothetical protein
MKKTEIVEMKNKIKISVECAICCEDFCVSLNSSSTPYLMENCGHSICKRCYDEIGSKTCPFCKVVSEPEVNFTLIDLLENGYLTCTTCLYPLRTDLKNCYFNKKGKFCFSCSKTMRNGLKNFSVITAIMNHKNSPKSGCKLDKEDCIKKYDLKNFEEICDCSTETHEKNLFSNFFKNSTLFDKSKYEIVVKKVFEDTHSIYDRNKNQNKTVQKLKELISFKNNLLDSIEKIKESWTNFLSQNLFFLEKEQLFETLEKESKNNNETLLLKVKNDTKNFTDFNIDILFETAENNKLLDNLNEKFVIENGDGFSFNENNLIDYLNTLSNKINLVAKDISNFIKNLKNLNENDSKFKTNFSYKKHPFLNLNPMYVK